MKSNSLLITITVAIVIGAAGFFGGMYYQKTQVTTNTAGQYAQGGQGRMGNGGRRGGFGNATIGKVVSVDANSATIQLPDGSSKIINISSSTRITKTQSASVSDLTPGQIIGAFGSANSDGSITAQNIQLNPMMRGRGGQGTPNPTQ